MNLQKLETQYSWLVNSQTAEYLKKEPERVFNYPVCDINTTDLPLLLNVIRLWELKNFPPELVEELKKFSIDQIFIEIDRKNFKLSSREYSEIFQKILEILYRHKFEGNSDHVKTAISQSLCVEKIEREKNSTIQINFTNPNSNNFHNFHKKLCLKAIEKGDLEMLKLIHENGVPFMVEETSAACSVGNLEILMYLRENSCPWNFKCWREPVKTANCQILRYLSENLCPRDPYIIYLARETKNEEVLQILRTNGFSRYEKI